MCVSSFLTLLPSSIDAISCCLMEFYIPVLVFWSLLLILVDNVFSVIITAIHFENFTKNKESETLMRNLWVLCILSGTMHIFPNLGLWYNSWLVILWIVNNHNIQCIHSASVINHNLNIAKFWRQNKYQEQIIVLCWAAENEKRYLSISKNNVCILFGLMTLHICKNQNQI